LFLPYRLDSETQKLGAIQGLRTRDRIDDKGAAEKTMTRKTVERFIMTIINFTSILRKIVN